MFDDEDPYEEDPYIGRMLSGRYQLRAKLKGGQICRVYEAVDTRLGSEVVVKFIDPSMDSAEHLRRLQREGVALCCVRHARVVRLLDWDIDASGIEFIALERVKGETLYAYMRGVFVVEPTWAARIAVWMLEALEAVHAAGLLHRDVKPSNVILTGDGLTLIDFNLVIPLPGLRTDRTWQRITLPDTCVGTPSYLPPERLPHAEPGVGEDIYAMGLVLYEMLVGRRPHAVPVGPFGTVDPYWSPPPPTFPSRAWGRMSSALQTITLQALEKIPERRFASAAEMRQALLDLKP